MRYCFSLQLFSLAALLVVGCGSAAKPPPPPPPPDLAYAGFNCDDHPTSDAGVLEPTFSNVQKLFDDSCDSCHCCNGQVVLSRGLSFAALVNKMAPDAKEACGGPLVTPGDPAHSYLYQKLAGSSVCYGQKMPLTELLTPGVLPACAVDVVRRWIEAGAPNN